MLTDTQIMNAQLAAKDPENILLGEQMPVLTVLLHRVCNNDVAKFEEACRLIDIISVKLLEVNDESNLSGN